MNNEVTPDQAAAHQFLCELRTRITTQPLPYQHGVEARALESLWEVFGQAREAMKKYPGCDEFAAAVTRMLNVHLRPVTAKWHRAHAEGRLNSRDGADEFRGDLASVQKQLREFSRELHSMAYGKPSHDQLVPPVWTPSELEECFTDLPYGIPHGTRSLPDKQVDDINSDESDEIVKRRKSYDVKTPAGRNAVGLGLSGGGIRSATFSLGVVQVLAERGLLKDVDYLSTVSGGGYTGSFLSARLGTTATEKDVAGPFGPDPEPVRYVRHHAKFLNPVNLKDAWSIIIATLAGMVLNWTVLLLVIVLAALIADLFDGQILKSLDPAVSRQVGLTEPGNTASFVKAFWPTVFKITGVLTGAALVVYCGLLRAKKTSTSRLGAWILGVSAALTAAAGACWLANTGYAHFRTWALNGWDRPAGAGLVGAIIAAGPAILRSFPALQKPGVRKIAMKVVLLASGLVIPLLALLLFYVCRLVGDAWAPAQNTVDATKGNAWIGYAVLAGISAGLALVSVFLLNINLTAPHRLYRDRLAKTFILTTGSQDAPVPLSSINSSHRAPYHLINTTLNLPASELPALRDRRCSFFLFSKHWTGAATTGYHKTEQWLANGNPVDLATVMAVSGAAASSHMGLESMPSLTALLTALNVRLGFWIRRPEKKVWSESPGFLCLLKEITSVGMSEEAAWLNLSDGGHIENTGVYELLRRRCKFILCVDGEADPDFTFGGLMTLARHAQIDYGIRIEPRVNEIRPDPKSGFSQTHSLFCRIDYPAAGDQPPATGLLLYLKLSVTGNEPELVSRYRRLNPEFPHESTADQFFNEQQFEAYRQLGVHVAEGLFSAALMNDGNDSGEGVHRPCTVADWFRRLAGNLLEPPQDPIHKPA